MPDKITSGIKPVEFLTLAQARGILDALDKPIRLFPEAISDITLSGAATQLPSAYLELNVPTYVDGNSGEISFLARDGGFCGGEVYVRLLGLELGATYLGQLRCAAEVVNRDAAAVAVNIFGGAQGTQFGQVRVTQRAMAVPFVFISPRGPVPLHQAADAPLVAFNPVKLRNWYVHDIRIQRVA